MSVESAEKDRIENEASAWILKRDRGDFTAEDRMALEAWLSADARHRDSYLRLIELWRYAGSLKVWRPVDGQVRADVLDTPKRPVAATRRWPLSLAAAGVLLALVAATIWYVRGQRGTYVTQVGGYQRLLLEDGSIVQLNTDTRVQVRFSREGRTVRLLKGEASFDIARDTRRPFDVVAAGTMVRAVGTAFSVRLRGTQRVDVLVTQGRVSVQELAAAPEVVEASAARSLLAAGQAAQAKPEGITVATLEPAELTRRMAWQSGVLHFKSDPLAAVVAEFNRYNQRQIEIADPQLAGVEIGGSFKANDLDSFAAALRGIRGVQVDQRADRIRLSGSFP